MHLSISLTTCAFVCLVFIHPQSAHCESPWTVVALTGQTAPGTNLPFTGFDAPTLNTRGDIAILGRVPKIGEGGVTVPCARGGAGCILTESGAWRSLAGELLEPLVLPGQNLPAAPGPAQSATSVVMNDSGLAAVLVQFPNGSGIY